MGVIFLDNYIKGDIAEVVFEHFCYKNRFAYLKSEDIFRTLEKNNLVFRYGQERIPALIDYGILPEIDEITTPSNNNLLIPTFVLDYLTVNLRHFKRNGNGYYKILEPVLRDDLTWAEVKYNSSRLSANQEKIIGKTNIEIKTFTMNFNLPKTFEMDLYKA